MQTRSYLIHNNGPALWPGHKSLKEVLDLKATTPEITWSGTYQGLPTPPSGFLFKRAWFDGKNRYHELSNVLGYYISWDTGLKETESSAYTSGVVGALLADYRLAIWQLRKDRIEFPTLPAEIEAQAERYKKNLLGIIIEDKASGISAIQTLKAGSKQWLADLLIPFNPTVDKYSRANQASVWCGNDSILLPHPSSRVSWLQDFENDFFDYPSVTFSDTIDALSQLIIYLENILAAGWRARQEA